MGSEMSEKIPDDVILQRLEKAEQSIGRLEMRVKCLEDNEQVILKKIRELYGKMITIGMT